MSGVTAFREAFLSANLADPENFTEWDARRLRYSLYWAMYENTAYRNIHSWAVTYRQQQALYRWIRGIYNPTYRLGDFWRSHVWGGRLDPDAGDGKETPSAIPIITENEALRPALAQLWRWSNWGINKGILPLWGSVLGDLAIQATDDPAKKQVYLQLIHPSIIKETTLDSRGNVKGYVIEEQRSDPRNPNNNVTYQEIVERDGDNVTYRTLLNGQVYAWNGTTGEWSAPYGFVPMVMIQHNNVGLQWGWSEIHSGRAKFQETDDIASKLNDQVRKTVDAAWFFTKMEAPRSTPKITGTTPTSDNPQPGRQEVPAIYAPEGSTATPLIATLDIAGALANIDAMLKELEKDYPELQMDIWAADKAASGRALRTARMRVETKVEERRPNYDDALIRIQQMAVAIGGYRKYEGFAGFGLDSYQAGDLDHYIGDRPVFAKDPLDDIEVEQAFWTAANAATKAGVPLFVYLKRQGWSDEQVSEIEASPEYQAKLAGMKSSMMLAESMGPDSEGTRRGNDEDRVNDREPTAPGA